MGFGIGSFFGKNKNEEDTEIEKKEDFEYEEYSGESPSERILTFTNERLKCITHEDIEKIYKMYGSDNTSATEKENEVIELKNVNFIRYDFGIKDDTDFISLTSENRDYIYYQSFAIGLPENISSDEFTIRLLIKCGMDRAEAEKRLKEPYKINQFFFMNTNGEFEFFISLFKYDKDGEAYLDKQIDFLITENERNMIIDKARLGFMKVYGVDLLKLPELIKHCSTVEQLYDRFAIESGKGIEGIIKEYGLENMRTRGFEGFGSDLYKKSKTVLTCIFTPNLNVSMNIRNNANMQNFGTVQCIVWFNNKMNMTLTVKDGNETLNFEPEHTLAAEIRAGISAMYEKYKGYSLVEYIQRNCPEVLTERLSSNDIEYYCGEIRKQKFFSENMTPDFFEDKCFYDWVQAWSSMGCPFYLTPKMFHQEFDYYKSPNAETRNKFLNALRQYKLSYDTQNFNQTDEDELPF